MQTGNGGLPGPLRRFSDRLKEVRSADVVNMDQVGRVLVELAADEEFFAPLFDRQEYDPERGTWQALAPGDPGRDNR